MSLIGHKTSGSRAVAQLAEKRMRQWTLDLEVQQQRLAEPSAEELREEIHPCITISREAGAGGGVIARRLGEKLGREVLHREILDDMANRYDLRRDMLDSVDETTSNWIVEVFGKWINQRLVTQSEYTVHLGQLVLLAAKHASHIFVGRGAYQFLLPVDKCLSVYLVAPMPMRIEQICESRQCSAPEAKRYIRETDQGRREFVKRYFNHEIGDPHLYDLVINRAHIGVEEAADLIVAHWQNQFAS